MSTLIKIAKSNSYSGSLNTESLNQNIILEFEKLVSFIQLEIDNAKKNNDKKLNIVNSFRQKQIKNALNIIKKYPKKITEENLGEFNELPGIGKGTINRIKEILKNGYLSELSDFKTVVDPNEKIIEELESIVGVGRTTALELVKQGITSVSDLKKKIKSNLVHVNDKILLGIKYYGKFLDNIPREEITKVYKLIKKEIDKLNKKYKLDDNNKYIFEICGSYRREKLVSGDIDILVSKLGTTMNNPDKINHLDRLVKILKNPIKLNNNNPLLVDDITDKNYETKYMGFAKYKDNPYRRIDIRYVSYDVYPSALLYFTGSAELNLKMRKIAKKLKLKLSEYGLTKEDGTLIPITSEYDVFKILKIEYLSPNLR
jgi:DNA polymerase/3'-5' exonuclease PolX